jgi:serine/threonine protein kinase
MVYFCGLLLKAGMVGDQNEASMMDLFIVALFTIVLGVIFFAILLEIKAVWHKREKKRRLQRHLSLHSCAHIFEEAENLIRFRDLHFGAVLSEASNVTVRKGTWRSKAVAIKIYSIVGDLTPFPEDQSEDKVDQASIIEEVKKEAAALKLIQHPNVLRIWGITFQHTKVDLNLCTVMELCAGSLEDQIYNEDVKLTLIERLTYLLQITQGVQCLHEQGIYHR